MLICAICVQQLVSTVDRDEKFDNVTKNEETEKDWFLTSKTGLLIYEMKPANENATTKTATRTDSKTDDDMVKSGEKEDSGDHEDKGSYSDSTNENEEDIEKTEYKVTRIGERTKARMDPEVSAMESEEFEDFEEDNGEAFSNNCHNGMSSFVRHFDYSPYLPDDFEEVYENVNLGDEMTEGNVYGQIDNINDTLHIINRLVKYGDKLKGNSDILNSAKYLLSILSDKLLYDARMSSECTADLIKVMQAARNGQLWAWKCEKLKTFSSVNPLPFPFLPF